MAAETEIKLPDAFQQHRLLSFKEAAQFLGIRPGTMYKMLASKKDPLPSIRLGRLHKFQLEKLIWWAEKHEQ